MKISMTVVSFLLTLLLITEKNVMAKLTMTQSSSEVIVGGTTRMSCVTALQKEIYWFHFPAGNLPQREVYAYGRMHSPYRERFQIQINKTTGFYELTIPRVELTDAGVYTCQEEDGSGDSDQGRLTVLEAVPTCTSDTNPLEFIGPNSCNIQHENLTLACSVAYRGDIDPQLEWKMIGSNDAIAQGIKVEKTGNRIIYHLSIPSQPTFDGSSFVCGTTKSQLNCTSDVINVIYVIGSDFTQKAEIGDTVVCNANTDESCSYRWKWFKGEDVVTASNNRTLIPKQPGNFRCEAVCSIRQESCIITAMFASVEDGNATYIAGEPIHGASYVAVIVSVVVVAVLITSCILLLIFFTKRRVRRRERSDQLPLMENGVLDVKVRDDIPKYYAQMPFIEKGSSGEISGPFIFQGMKCACEKILHTSTDGTYATVEEDVCRQGKRWMKLDHNNVLKFFDVLFKHPALFIVMDYAEGGSVRKALNSCEDDLEISVVKDWATQIANGMNYLHNENIVHKRLRAAQILMMKPFEATDPSPQTLKIASYRLSPDREGQSTQFSFKGLFGWMAPEAVRGDGTVKASDVWSYGVTIWEILTRKIPHSGVKLAVLIKDLSEGNRPLAIPDRCPDAIRDVLKNCWMNDKERRPTFSAIVSRLNSVPDC